MKRETYNEFLMTRIDKKTKRKAVIVAEDAGMPNLSVFIREMLDNEISKYEAKNGIIELGEDNAETIYCEE